eukprot:51385-Amphidinium_carterae.1
MDVKGAVQHRRYQKLEKIGEGARDENPAYPEFWQTWRKSLCSDMGWEQAASELSLQPWHA